MKAKLMKVLFTIMALLLAGGANAHWGLEVILVLPEGWGFFDKNRGYLGQERHSL